MKKLQNLVPVLILSVFVLVGCGCRNSKPVTTAPTATPTTAPTTAATTAPTTMPTTAPSTEATTEVSTEATIEDGNGPVTSDNARNGFMQPGNGSMNSTTGTGSGITGSITG